MTVSFPVAAVALRSRIQLREHERLPLPLRKPVESWLFRDIRHSPTRHNGG